MVSTKLHSIVDSLDVRNTFHLNESSFVDHGDEDTVYYESCSLVDLNRGLADLFGDLLDRINGFNGSVNTCDNLDKLHSVSRIEEVHSYNRTVNALSDLGDGKR